MKSSESEIVLSGRKGGDRWGNKNKNPGRLRGFRDLAYNEINCFLEE